MYSSKFEPLPWSMFSELVQSFTFLNPVMLCGRSDKYPTCRAFTHSSYSYGSNFGVEGLAPRIHYAEPLIETSNLLIEGPLLSRPGKLVTAVPGSLFLSECQATLHVPTH